MGLDPGDLQGDEGDEGLVPAEVEVGLQILLFDFVKLDVRLPEDFGERVEGQTDLEPPRNELGEELAQFGGAPTLQQLLQGVPFEERFALPFRRVSFSVEATRRPRKIRSK